MPHLAAVVFVIAATISALWAFDLAKPAQWRIPDAKLEWIRPSPGLLPRPLAEGENPGRISQMPLADSSAVQITYRFKPDAKERVGRAILAPSIDGNAQAFVNFAPIRGRQIRTDPGLIRPLAQSWLWEIPSDHFVDGQNRIDILVDGAYNRSLAAPLHLGTATELEQVTEWRASAVGKLRWLVIAISALALIVNLGAFVLRAPDAHLAIAAAFAAIGLRFVLADAAQPLGWAWPCLDVLFLSAAATCAGFGFSSQGNAGTRSSRITIGLATIAVLAAAGALLAASKEGQAGAVWGGVLASVISFIVLIHAIARSAMVQFAQAKLQRIFAGIVVGLCLCAAFVALLGANGVVLPGSPLGTETVLATALSALAAIASITGWLAFVRALRIRLDLVRTIRQQRAALEAASRELEEKSRQSALLEERQRMARDVHDGIGGQLASLIAQVRMRRISMDNVEQALVSGLTELRFLVTSLDAMGISLTDALAAFLDRAQQQTAASGMTLDWNQADDLPGDVREPQWILNLYRLMQEAINNAIRHSGGDRISVSIANRDGCILVRIEDNGTGMDLESIKRGRGLANMERRASELGGSFSVAPASSGPGLAALVLAPLPQ